MLLKIKNLKLKISSQGFTLIELLIAFALFAVIIAIVSGIFITTVRSQKTIARLISANNNMYLLLEQMSREMRVGRNFTFVQSAGKLVRVNFDNPEGDAISYWEQNGGIMRTKNGLSKKISSDDISVAQFFITNTCGGLPTPVRVTLHLTVGTTGPGGTQDIRTPIQTTTAVRNLSSC